MGSVNDPRKANQTSSEITLNHEVILQAWWQVHCELRGDLYICDFCKNVLKADLSQSLPAEEHLLRLIYSCSFELSSNVNEHGAFKGGLLLDERLLS